MQRKRCGIGAVVMAIGWITLGSFATATAWQEPEPNQPEGAQVLTQGPIHEAFAQPVLFDPKPGPVVPKTPPAPISEVPPEQKPEGANVHWIPGYWAWDDARTDFIWVSGLWRSVPPGRQYIPGYWQHVEGGFQYVPGYWASTEVAQVQYLPQPPASLENGPNAPAPAAGAVWAPGTWVWQGDQYLWRPGFWVASQPGWMWMPASYSWTPYGYVYNPGFWDYPFGTRGVVFAPVYFAQPVYAQPSFVFSPVVSLLTPALSISLFVRPSYHSYYFGDYYATSYFRSGIYPWYAFHGSRYGYDPLYAHAAAENFRTNPRWAEELHETYTYRREHPDARPPHTYEETRALAARSTTSNLVLASPVSRLAAAGTGGAAGPNALRFERISEARRQEFAQRGAELHQFRQERVNRELEAHRATPLAERSAPRQLELPRSPIGVSPRGEGSRFTPPAAPNHPELDRGARAAVPGAASTRHEPHPEIRPPAPYAAPGRRAGTESKRK